jgi:hypothetical protein
MSAVTLAVIFGFLGCAALIRVLSLRDNRTGDIESEPHRAHIPVGTPEHAMMNE